MTKTNDEGQTTKADVAQQRRLYDQFELAKKIYAAHSLLRNAAHWALDQQKIENFLKVASAEFRAVGGIAQTGTNSLGEHGPMLSGENGDVFDYAIGRLLAENYRTAGAFSAST